MRARLFRILLLVPALTAGSATAFHGTERGPTPVITPPPPGHLYHGVYPGGRGIAEHEIGAEHLQAYQTAVGKKAAWVYFSEEWYDGLAFPRAQAEWIKAQGRVPFIRMTPRDRTEMGLKCTSPPVDPVYPLDDILGTRFDAELARWMADARDYAWPVIVEFGTEMNGAWFPWSGKHNGGGETRGYGDPRLPDGPERFRDSFRKLVRMAGEAGAANITWVFHVASEGCPGDPGWNAIRNYYPGPDSVDWIGVSVYGPQEAGDNDYVPFEQRFTPIYQRLRVLDRTKPIVVAEFGAKKDRRGTRQAAWAAGALDYLVRTTPPGVIGFSWWSSAFPDGGRLIDMRVQAGTPLGDTMRARLANHRVLEDPIVVFPPP